MTKATLPAGISKADIEAFLAAKAAKEAAEKKASKKPADKKARLDPDAYRAKKAEVTKEVQDTFAKLSMAVCKTTKAIGKGENELPEGTQVEVIWLGANRWLAPTARCLYKGEDRWINPEHLTPVKTLPAERKAALEAAREAEASATVTLPCRVVNETDKGVTLRYAGFFRPLSFSREMVTYIGDDADGTSYYEVPAWKIRQDVGAAALEAVEAKDYGSKVTVPNEG
jgi:uncharacterized MAPEG superfamily protein